MATVLISLEERYYKKDPQSSELGKSIISGSVDLIDTLGFEDFTFRKLAERIGSTEASIYRYFDNKLMLLVYISAWYWTWMEYVIDIKIMSKTGAKEKLKITLEIICLEDTGAEEIASIGLELKTLRRIVFNESDKTYMTKKVDEINSQGLFKEYKSLCHKVALIIEEIDPNYSYSHSLVSTIMEAAHQQAFFAQHLPSLTEIKKEAKVNIDKQVLEYLEDLVTRVLK